jgi:hypothetical protein
MKIFRILGIIFIIFAIIIAIHQFIYYDVWFEIEELHHETWMIMFAFAGALLLLKRK